MCVCVISSIRREVDDNFAVLGYYAASSFFLFLTVEDGADTLSQNVSKQLPYSLRNNPDERSSHHVDDLEYS
jgi:hypothetical protein